MYKCARYICLACLLLDGFNIYAQQLLITVKGFRNNKGNVQLSAYADAESFKREKPFRIYEFPKDAACEGQLQLCIDDLSAGTWGIALIDDENMNHRLDFHLLVPSEGFSFSNMPFREHRKPDFSSFSFILADTTCHIHFDMNYFTGKDILRIRNKD